MIQSQMFHVDLFSLDFRGADVVLGAQWLKQLGLVLMNYNSLTMTFIQNNTCIELQGDLPIPTIGLHQFQKLAQFENPSLFFSLHISSITPETQTLSPHLTNLNP